MSMTRRALNVLIIDHYDSYTNNLLQLLPTGQEKDAVDAIAWNPRIIRYDRYTWNDFKDSILPKYDAIILSPGPGRPDHEADFGFNSQLIREAEIPILGICLGHQGIGTSYGAQIIHAPHIKHGQVSHIQHDGSGLFEGLPQNFEGVQYNSLLLDLKTLCKDLVVTAWTKDDIEPNVRICMGVSHRTKPINGVQWHPESVCSSFGAKILENFGNIVRNFWSSTPERLRHFSLRVGPTVKSHSVGSETARRSTDCDTASHVISGIAAYSVRKTDLGSGPLPNAVFEHLIHDTAMDGEAWLDSAKSRDHHSRFSYLANGSFSLTYSTENKALRIYQGGQPIEVTEKISSFFEWFDSIQKMVQDNVEPLPSHAVDQDVIDGRPTLQVGFIGYFGYEMKRESLPGYDWRRPNDGAVLNATPDAQFFFAQEVLRYDHATRQWTFFGLVRSGSEDPIGCTLGLSRVFGLTPEQFDLRSGQIAASMSSFTEVRCHKISIPHFSMSQDKKSYTSTIDGARTAIKDGDSYEMTLTTKFQADLEHRDRLELYRALREKNPAPYAAYIDFPATRNTILSSSPERFISIDQRGVAEMKPIKGTVAVSEDPDEDERIKKSLAMDVKELAENLMIVDLIRNDLHNIAPPNTITVPKLMQVESYETVHQLVTTIQAKIDTSTGPVKAISSIFPPGSMTGAPKLRSVQILESLERSETRGIYSGCLGYICVSGAIDQSVIIRTIVRHGDHLELGAGGAITWLSDPEKEWHEVLVKANAVAEVGNSQVRADSLEPVAQP